jgi:hypothetical protein
MADRGEPAQLGIGHSAGCHRCGLRRAGWPDGGQRVALAEGPRRAGMSRPRGSEDAGGLREDAGVGAVTGGLVQLVEERGSGVGAPAAEQCRTAILVLAGGTGYATVPATPLLN